MSHPEPPSPGNDAARRDAPARLEIRGLDHSFGGVHAVADVSLAFRGGEVCALLGENGAGKSTLMRAVAGALRPERGVVLLDGRPLPPGDPGSARERGIGVIYQELSLAETLSAAENIFLGRELRRGGLVDHERQGAEAAAMLERLGARIDPAAPVETLAVAERQLVEIARAIARDLRVLIMDEPTSALSDREARRLFDVVRRLAADGTAVIFVTHRLEEVEILADRVVVMRDGAVVADGPAWCFTIGDLVREMVGRPLDRQFPPRERKRGAIVLSVSGLEIAHRARDVSFDVRAGEVVALTGLVGSGRTEIGRALFGIETPARGTISFEGRRCAFAHPADAIAAGIGWVSEDRKGEGLVTGMSLAANLTLPHLRGFAGRTGWIDSRAERESASTLVQRLGIRAVDPDQAVAELSGGNQQKVAFARWLVRDCRLLVCDEPTRGVDAGGRYEIYELIESLARRGVAILMISSDMQEVLGMADRIVVMHEGGIAGEMPAEGATQEAILRLAMGQAA